MPEINKVVYARVKIQLTDLCHAFVFNELFFFTASWISGPRPEI